MDKIDILGEYIEYREFNHSPSFEASAGTVYTNTLAKLRAWLRSSGAVAAQVLGKKPWQDPAFKTFIQEGLTGDFKLNDKMTVIEGNNAGWFLIGTAPIGSRSRASLIESWELELEDYTFLMDKYYPICITYLDWALNATQAILLKEHINTPANYDQLVKDRPETVAEALKNTSMFWLGMQRAMMLSTSKTFGQNPLTIIDIPVTPRKTGKVPVPGIFPRELDSYSTLYNRYGECVDKLNVMFVEFDKRINRLKSYREIVSVNEEYHRIFTDIDQEMMLYFNIELFSALYSRAGSIQDAIAQYLFVNIEQK